MAWYNSSADPNKVSLTFKGAGVAVIPIVVFFGKFFGIELAEAELVQLIESIASAVAAVMIVIGLGRKVWLKAFSRKE